MIQFRGFMHYAASEISNPVTYSLLQAPAHFCRKISVKCQFVKLDHMTYMIVFFS